MMQAVNVADYSSGVNFREGTVEDWPCVSDPELCTEGYDGAISTVLFLAIPLMQCAAL